MQAIQKKPDFEIAIIHLGNLYFQLGRYREAEGQFLEYIRHSASDAERARGHSSLAWMYWRKGDSARAQTQADQAARLSPQWSGESLLLAADRGTLKLTEDVRRQILAPEPYAGRGSRLNERRRLFLAGYIALRDHRTDEALAHFRAALQVRSHCIAEFINRVGMFVVAAVYPDLGRLDNLPVWCLPPAVKIRFEGMQRRE